MSTRSLRFATTALLAAVVGCVGATEPPQRVAKAKEALVLSSTVCPTFTLMTGPVLIRVITEENQYSPRCVQVAPGTTVTIQAGIGHPLTDLGLEDASDAPNPFEEPTGIGYETHHTAVLNDEGLYGFLCTFHGAEDGTGMTGVIKVAAPAAP